jgi:hypothetical protein
MTGEVFTVAEFLLLFEEQQFFKYIAVVDDRTCKACMKLDGLLMTRREIYRRFKYLVKISGEVWLPMTHPNCRCMLVLWELQK